jgi:hypothetical protein
MDAGDLSDDLGDTALIAEYEVKIAELRAQGRPADDGSRLFSKAKAVGTPG